MKRIFISLFAILLSFEASAAVFRLATYNVKGLPFPIQIKHISRYKKITKAIRAMEKDGKAPDVILVQEAFSTLSNYIYLKLRDIYPYRVRGPSNRVRWNSGLEILSRYPIEASGKVAFGSCDSFDCLSRKGVAFARVRLPAPVGFVDVYDTHMQANNAGRSRTISGNVRIDQSETMIDFVKATHGDVPLFMGGDLNAKTPDESYQMFLEAFGDIETASYCRASSGCPGFFTQPASYWDNRIDHIFYRSGKVKVRPLDYETFFQDTNYSDHPMIMGTYELEP